jgi:hypothetical protein
VCDVLFVTLPAFLTVPELATRILFLVDKQLLDEQQPGGSAERKSLESSNLVGGAIMFLYDWLRGFHLYLSSHQLCEVKTLIYDMCTRMHVHYTKQKRGTSTTSTTATTITAASSSNRLDDNHKELEKLRNTINEIVSERSWIEVGCIPRRKKLNHHGFSSLSEYSVSHSIAGGYRCVAAPFVAQTKGEWSGAAVQARRKTVKDALAKAAHVHINVFGGAGLLGSLNDESDEDEYLPFSPSTGRRSEAGAGDVVEVDYPVPRVPSGVSLLQDPSTIDFWTVDPMEIARQWTLVDHGLFCAIPPACFLQLTWTEPRHKVRMDGLLTQLLLSFLPLTPHPPAPHHPQNVIAQLVAVPIRRFIDRFNTASLWATASVLACQTAQDRADRYSDLISLASCLESLGNYNGLMSVLTGLQQGSISRLYEMLVLVSQDDKEKLADLQNTMAGNKNYQNYREALKAYDAGSGNKDKAGKAVVPHLGAHLAELTSIDEGNPEFLPDQPHLFNYTKKRLLARSVSLLVSLQARRFMLVPVRLVASILARALDKHIHLTSLEANEAARQLFELSKYLEPPVPAATGLLHTLAHPQQHGHGHGQHHHHHAHHHHAHHHQHGDVDAGHAAHRAAPEKENYEIAGIAEYALPEEEQESSDESDEDGGAPPKPTANKKKVDATRSKSAGAWKRLQLLVGISKKDKQTGDGDAPGKKKAKSKAKGR